MFCVLEMVSYVILKRQIYYIYSSFLHLYTIFIMAPKTIKSRLDRLLLLSFVSLRLSKQLLRCHFQWEQQM